MTKTRKMHTFDTAQALTRGQLRKAFDRNRADCRVLADLFIARGMGHVLSSELCRMAATDPDCARFDALMCELSALNYANKTIYGGYAA